MERRTRRSGDGALPERAQRLAFARGRDPSVRADEEVIEVGTQRDLGSELFSGLWGVVRRGYVAGQPRSASAAAMAASMAPALLRVSASSVTGLESATIPAPAWTWATPSFRSTVRMVMQVSRLPAKSM